MFKKAFTTLAVGCAFGLALDTHADTVSYTSTIGASTTDWNNILTLEQFNTSLGTLDSIDISISSTMSTVLTVTNSAASSSTGTAKTEVQLSLDTSSIGGYDVFGTGGAPVLDYLSSPYGYSLAPGQGITSGTHTGSSTDDSGLLSNPSLLSYFLGGGDVDLGASTYTQTLVGNNGGNTSADQVTTAGLSATITYDYTAAPVPEPSPFIMLGAGLLSLGLVMRRRQSTH